MVLFYIIFLLVHMFKPCFPGCDYRSLQAVFRLLCLFFKYPQKLNIVLRADISSGHMLVQRNRMVHPVFIPEATHHDHGFTMVCDTLVVILKCWSPSSSIKINLRITSSGQLFRTTLRIISPSLLCAPLCSGCALIIVYTTSFITPYYLLKCSFSLFEYEALWRGSVLLVLHWPWKITGLIIYWIRK